MSNFTWWEVVEDTGDGEAVVRRFSTYSAAMDYIYVYNEHECIQLLDPYEVSPTDIGFFDDGLEIEVYGDE